MASTAMKYSRQREAVREFLMSRKDHPTAETVYNNLREHFPNISLGTITEIFPFLLTSAKQLNFRERTVLIILMEMSGRTIILYVNHAER